MIALNSTLVEHGGEGFRQERLLFGEDGADVENEAFIFDARNNRDTRGSAAEALFEFCSRVTGAGDANDFCGKRLRRRGTATGERTAIRDFDLDFIERKFAAQLADEILRAAL